MNSLGLCRNLNARGVEGYRACVSRRFLVVRATVVVALLAVAISCAPMQEVRSHWANPVGWPSRGFQTLGHAAADTGVPLVRETGRLLLATGDLADSPALFVQGAATLSGDAFRHAADRLLAGTGGTVTASLNLPFFFVTGANVDIGREARLVNEALAHLETLEPSRWRYWPGDERTFIFPLGTRVRASGKNLVWVFPSGVEILQAAQESPLFRASLWASGMQYGAQERSWGFVVPDVGAWNDANRTWRVGTILHEFYHQHQQMRAWLRSWTVLYWPAYGVTFLFAGWEGHWAEVKGPHAAAIVERGLRSWIPLESAGPDTTGAAGQGATFGDSAIR